MYKIEVNNLLEDSFENISNFDLLECPSEEQALSYVTQENADNYSDIVVQVYC
jgi:hypothetical protein